MSTRVAAIGIGHWHSLFDAAYLKLLAGMSDVRIVGVQDSDVALVAERAKQLGDPLVFADYQEMISKLRPDFVIVLGRHDAMAATVHYLLDEGYPFLVEKPAGINATEVREIADKARDKRAFACVPLFQRYHPFFDHARRMLADEVFGPLSSFYFRAMRPTSARYVEWGAPWMLDPDIAGGGSLRNTGMHGIDLFLALTGETADVAGAQISSRALGEGVEDYAAVLLRTPSGVLATIETGNTHPGKGGDAEWRLSGRDASLTLREGAVRCVTSAGERELALPNREHLSAVMLRDTFARWRAGQPPRTDLEDCYRVARIVDQAYALARH